MSSAKTNTLTLYKSMLKFAKRLPKTKQEEWIEQIRTNFRANQKETDRERIQQLLEKANSSLGYLKIISPRTVSQSQTGHTRIIFGSDNGISGKAVTNWTGSNLDPDSIKRHNNNLKRAGFKNNRDAKGYF